MNKKRPQGRQKLRNFSSFLNFGPVIVFKSFIKLFLPLSCLLVIIAVLIGLDGVSRHRKTLMVKDSLFIKSQKEILENGIAAYVSDILYLANIISPETDNGTHDSIKKSFLAFLHEKRAFASIKYLDLGGREVVRIENVGREVVLVPDEELRDEGSLAYFRNIKNLTKREVFISEFSLYHQDDAAPGKPVIYFVCPVFGAESGKIGFIVFCLPEENLLAHLKNEADFINGQLLFTNKEGFFLIGPSEEYEWTWITDPRDKFNISSFLPVSSNRILEGREGQFLDREGLVSFINVYPYNMVSENTGLITLHGIFFFWKLIIHTPPESLLPAWFPLLILIPAAALLILAFLVRIWAGMRSRNVQAERKLLRNYDVQRILNQFHQISQKDISPDEFLVCVLDIIFDFKWLKNKKCGNIYIMDKKRGRFVLRAEKGIPEHPFSRELYPESAGQLATDHSLRISGVGDTRRYIHLNKLEIHGQYSIPILQKKEIKGLLNIFLEEGFMTSPEEEDILNILAFNVAGIIIRKQMESELIKHRENLEEIVDERTRELQKLTEELRRENLNSKRREEELKKLSLAVSQSPFSVVMTDKQGRIYFVNRKFTQITGYLLNDVVGKNSRMLKSNYHPNDFYKDLWETIGDGRIWEGEICNKKKSGEIYWESVSIAPIFGEDGQITDYVAVKEDVTTRKKMEREIQESESRLKKILTTSNEGFWLFDNKSCTIDVNRTMCEILERPRQKIIGKSVYDFMDRKNKAILESQRQSFKRGRRGGLEVAFSCPGGKMVPALFNMTNLYDDNNNRIGFFAMVIDISDRKSMEHELIRAKSEAEAANRAKSDFLANMSHEIRTPMNAIMGLTYLALQGNLPAEQQDYLKRIYSSSKALLRIINSVLDFTKIEAGMLEIESIEFNLEQVFENLITMVGFKAYEKNLELIIHVKEDVPYILIGDQLRLGQVLLNLTYNAIKFTARGEIVVVVDLVHQDDTEVILEFSVQDTGIGITLEQKKKLFKSFSQADQTTSRKYGGTGLGLAICKRIIEKMNGRIKVDSVPGSGTIFAFSVSFARQPGSRERKMELPEKFRDTNLLLIEDNASSLRIIGETITRFGVKVKKVRNSLEAIDWLMTAKDPPSILFVDWEMEKKGGFRLLKFYRKKGFFHGALVFMTDHSGKEEISRLDDPVAGILIKPIIVSHLYKTLQEVLKHTDDEASGEYNTEDYEEEVEKDLTGYDILLVEDNAINLSVEKSILEAAGIKADTAESGEKAVLKVLEKSYNCILMDIQMPGMNGYEATRMIRQQPGGNEVPIIAMTANAMQGDKERSLEAGMNDHVSKPIIPTELYKVIGKWLGKNIVVKKASVEEDEILNKLPGIDVALGLKHLLGNIKTFKRILFQFMEDYADIPSELLDLISEKKFYDAELMAHSINGIAGNIGALGLQDWAGKVEMWLSKEKKELPVDLLEGFTAEFNKIIASLKGLNMSGPPEEILHLPEGMTRDTLKEINSRLADINGLVKRNDTRAVEEIGKLINSLEGNVKKDFLEDLNDTISRWDFKKTENLLGDLAGMISGKKY